MIRITDMRTLFVVSVLAVALVVAPLTSAAFVTEDQSDDSNLSSGESLSGAFSVHGTDLDGEIDHRAFERELARADGETARAELLADRRIKIERRIAELESRYEQLRTQRRDGNVSAAAYRVRAAEVTAERRQLEGRLRTVRQESKTLPESVRETYGLDEAALNRSLARLEATSDPDFEATFSAVVGEDADDRQRLTQRDPHEKTERALERAKTTREDLTLLLESLETQGVDERILECARQNVSTADGALQRADESIQQDDSVTAETALVEARTDLHSARICLGTLDGNFTSDDFEFNESDYERDHEFNESDYERDHELNKSDYERDHELNKSDYEDAK